MEIWPGEVSCITSLHKLADGLELGVVGGCALDVADGDSGWGGECSHGVDGFFGGCLAGVVCRQVVSWES